MFWDSKSDEPVRVRFLNRAPLRPIGELKSFLEDTRARNFVPRGLLDVGANRGARLALSIFANCSVVMIELQDGHSARRMEAIKQTISSQKPLRRRRRSQLGATRITTMAEAEQASEQTFQFRRLPFALLARSPISI
jgi:hypothetical protein